MRASTAIKKLSMATATVALTALGTAGSAAAGGHSPGAAGPTGWIPGQSESSDSLAGLPGRRRQAAPDRGPLSPVV